ncbi:hypothetical protein BGZ51_005810 [Haplosporangium sp. Z 767]|nr:hypothetical protein BGZ51_005810 [Haplosporangium sp. Z 767]
MGSDLRTSARDLLTLAQKVSTLLKRHIDKLQEEIKSVEGTLTPKTEDPRSKQCQQAIELHQKVKENTELLKTALDHVEDIDDGDETRILREPMTELQIHVKDALKIASTADIKATLMETSKDPVAESPDTTSTTSRSAVIPIGFAPKAAIGIMASGTPPLSGHRHPLGLFSTSPKFTAQSPFSSTGRVAGSRLSFVAVTSSADPILDPLSIPAQSDSTYASTSTSTRTQPKAATLTAVSDGPLSIVDTGPVSTPVPSRTLSHNARKDSGQDTATLSSSFSSAASFSTAISSLAEPPLSSSQHLKTTATSAEQITSRSKDSERNKPTKILEPSMNPPQRRRVPRGLFSSNQEPSRTPKFDSGPVSSPTGSSELHGLSKGSIHQDNHTENISVHPAEDKADTSIAVVDSEANMLPSRGLTLSSHPTNPSLAEGCSAHPPTSSQQSPYPQHSPSSSSFPSPSTPVSGTRSPTSPQFQRAQSKPSPIQTTSILTAHSLADHGKKKPETQRNEDGDEGEEISQLAKDLESAMNPTPTEAVPQPYFLQGKGLLQRIPSQVSMDDGLLEEGREDHQSEESDRNEEHDGGSVLSRGTGSLRRQRSGRRRFRISRSRSRNRSKGRQESKSKLAALPIEVGYPGALTSSEWPFDMSPPQQQSLSALQQQQREHRSAGSSRSQQTPTSVSAQLASSSSTFPHHQQDQQQPIRAVPHLPFAESVSIGNPIRVGRGIGSFTVYSITLTLCDPAKAKVPSPSSRNWSRESPSPVRQDEEACGNLRAGHAVTESQPESRNPSLGSEGTEGATVEDGEERSPRDQHPPLSRPPSKASTMMTRSFSFPELGYSAERLLMEVQSANELPPISSLVPIDAPVQSTSASSTPASSKPIVDPRPETGTGDSAQNPATPAASPPRVIHVRKRYSDFVALRAQLVATFREPRRNGMRGRQLFAGSSSSRQGTAPSSASSSTVTTPRASFQHVRTNTLHLDGDDNDDEEDEDQWVSHSRTTSTTSSVGSVSLACGSIIRGLPKLPPKKVVGKFRPAFVEKRRRELEYFLDWVVAHPVIGDCPVVVQWFMG